MVLVTKEMETPAAKSLISPISEVCAVIKAAFTFWPKYSLFSSISVSLFLLTDIFKPINYLRVREALLMSEINSFGEGIPLRGELGANTHRVRNL